MSKTDNSALIALIVKVVDSRLKKILPGLIEKYINESVNVDVDETIIENITKSAKKQVLAKKSLTKTKSTSHNKNGNLMKMLMDDDDMIVTERSDPRIIEKAKLQKKKNIESKTYVKNNSILDGLLKQTAKELIDNPDARIVPDNGGPVQGQVAGAQAIRQSQNFDNRQLKQVMEATGADPTTAALLSRNYSGMFKSNKKPNTNSRRVVQQAINDYDADYGNQDFIYTNKHFQVPPVQEDYYEEPIQIQHKSVSAPMSMASNPNARVVLQDTVPSIDDYLPPDILAELQGNAYYSVEKTGHGEQ